MTNPFEPPHATTAPPTRRGGVVLGVAFALLLVQGVVIAGCEVLGAGGMSGTPLRVVWAAAVVASTALASEALRRRLATTAEEWRAAFRIFAVGQGVGVVALSWPWVVVGQIHLLQVALRVVAYTLLVVLGVAVGKRFARQA